MDLGLEGALTKECSNCGACAPLSATNCADCGTSIASENDPSALDFTADDYSQEDENYVPLHRSPNLLALREAVDEFRAGSLDQETYIEVVTDVQKSVLPLLKHFEHQAKLMGDKLPPEQAWVFTDGLAAYRAYYQSMELMKSEPEKGLKETEKALRTIDEMERRL